MAKFLRSLCYALAAASLAIATANATTVNFTIKDGLASVATGSFGYSSPNPVLSYSDLDAFSLTIGTSTFDLNFVTDPSRSTNTYFQFDTASSTFLHAAVPAMFNIDTQLASMSNSFGDGFIFTFDPNDRYYTYDGGGLGKNHLPWTSIETAATAVPEPASLALLGSGLLAAGAARRRTKGKATA